MERKSKRQLREEFLLAIPSIQGDASFVEIAQANNISHFSTKLSYIAALVEGGKMKPEEASKQIKDMFKAWKYSHNSLKDGWN